MKRKKGEKFKSYQSRREADNILTKIKLAWKYVWFSTGLDEKGKPVSETYVKSKCELINSRAGKAPDAPKRPPGDQAHNNKYNPYRDRTEFLSTSMKHDIRVPTAEHPDIEIYQQDLPLGERNSHD